MPHHITPRDIDIRDDYIGAKYSEVTTAGRSAMDMLARTEGILLDPVYTS